MPLREYGRVQDRDGNHIVVRESSDAEADAVWLVDENNFAIHLPLDEAGHLVKVLERAILHKETGD